MTPAAARRALRRAEPRARRAAPASTTPPSASPTSAGRGQYIARQVARWSKQYQAGGAPPHPGDGPADRVAAAAPAARRRDEHRPRRLPPRQRDLPSDRAARARGARLGAVHARPPAVRFRLPGDGVAAVAEEFRGLKGVDLAALGIPTEQDYVAAYCRRTGRDRHRALGVLPDLQHVPHRGDPARRARRARCRATPPAQNAIDQGGRARLVADVAWSMAQAQRLQPTNGKGDRHGFRTQRPRSGICTRG